MFRRPAALAASAFLAMSPVALTSAVAQTEPSPTGSEAQRTALAALDFLDGEWRGEAVIRGRDGQRTVLTQTERVGPLLGGSIKVIEGRGYDADGETQFNAMAVVAWDPGANRYTFRTWANGYSGDYPFERTEDGFRWEMPAGPAAKIQYVANIRDGVWREVGHYVAEGREPVPYIEMTLRRLGDSDWPAAGGVSAR